MNDHVYLTWQDFVRLIYSVCQCSIIAFMWSDWGKFDKCSVIYVSNQQNMNDFYNVIGNDFTNICLYTCAPVAKEAVDSVAFHLFSCIKFVNM